MEWEYVAHAIDTGSSTFAVRGLDTRVLTKLLNEYGAQGWEFVSAFPMVQRGEVTTHLGIVFRRPGAAVAVPPVQP